MGVIPCSHERIVGLFARRSMGMGALMIALMGTGACSSGGSARPSVTGYGAASAGDRDRSRLSRGGSTATPACAAPGGHVPTSGREPRVEDNPPPPGGWKLVPQAHVTTQMTAWAAMIVTCPSTYPMWSMTQQFFGAVGVMARVEWHSPDLGIGVVHRGVTLYEPHYEQAPAATLAKGM
jgi:hypothetical protein